jgi:two-component system chemotaxis response regulator CheY
MSTLLLLEHDPALRDQLYASLSGDGHVVVVAATPEDALEFLKLTAVNLVIANLSALNLNWAGFCAQSRELPGYAQLPVILLSTNGQQQMQPSGEYTAFIRTATPLPALRPLVRCSLGACR